MTFDFKQVSNFVMDALDLQDKCLPQAKELGDLIALISFHQQQRYILIEEKAELTRHFHNHAITQSEYQREEDLINFRLKEHAYDETMYQMMNDYYSICRLLIKRVRLYGIQSKLERASNEYNDNEQAEMRNTIEKLTKVVGHLNYNNLKEEILNKEVELQRLLRNYWVATAMLLTSTIHASAPIQQLPSELILYIASYLPASTFCDKNYKTLQDCFAFIMNTGSEWQAANNQKVQIVESTTAPSKFRWQFFSSTTKREREEEKYEQSKKLKLN